jgi:hypothetical protein
VLAVVFAALWLTGGWWTAALARGLVCESNLAPSDAILVENFDADYFVFERASRLRRAGFASRVIVPIPTDRRTSGPNDVALGVAQVMARVSHLGPFDIVLTNAVEPISLNVARDVLRFVEQERIRSVLVVAPLFRSRRSALVYASALRDAGVVVTCQPAKGLYDHGSWTRSWHGIENVATQWIKLQYYRLYVLPFRAREPRPADPRTSP